MIARHSIAQRKGFGNRISGELTAVAAEVDYLVTGNTRHFTADPEVARKSGLVFVTPAQLVDLLSDWA